MSDEDEGLLLILNDVEAAHEDEFNLWYDTEHMQERMAVPGFLNVRRYQAVSRGPRYCTLYRTESIATFESDEYRRRLASQTDWSRRMLKAFVEPNRLVGNIRQSLGSGQGGRLAVLRLTGGENRQAMMLATEIAKSAGVVAVRLFEAAPRLSGPVKEYRPVLNPLLKEDDRIIFAEASNSSVLSQDSMARICATAGVAASHLGVYAFTWGLDARRSCRATAWHSDCKAEQR